jgi:hypothetical protein
MEYRRSVLEEKVAIIENSGKYIKNEEICKKFITPFKGQTYESWTLKEARCKLKVQETYSTK